MHDVTSDPSTVPAVKAAGVNSLIATLRSMSTPEQFAQFHRRLPPQIAACIDRPRMAAEWIPLEDVAGLYVGAARDLFDGDIAALYEVGRRQMRSDLSGIYRVFLRVASPSFVATRSSALYEVYGRNSGTLRVRSETPTSLELVLDGRPFPSPEYFEALRGFIAGALELTGVKDLKVTMLEEHRTDGRAYMARWR